jgi:hypothetical protein
MTPVSKSLASSGLLNGIEKISGMLLNYFGFVCIILVQVLQGKGPRVEKMLKRNIKEIYCGE